MAILLSRWLCPPIPRRLNRLLHAGIGILMASGLGLCIVLRPDPSGLGTHRQLGLPGCLVCLTTGISRCPSCGLTTGFAHIMRGQWQAARTANPAASTVFVIWCAVLCYCFAVAALGVNWLAYEIPALAVLCTGAFIIWLTAL